jgi:hypothetical protein
MHKLVNPFLWLECVELGLMVAILEMPYPAKSIVIGMLRKHANKHTSNKDTNPRNPSSLQSTLQKTGMTIWKGISPKIYYIFKPHAVGLSVPIPYICDYMRPKVSLADS